MGDAFLNSLLVTIPSVVIPITIAAFAAYAFAWMEFPGKSFLFVVVVGLMVVPLQMSLIPLLRLYAQLDLNGTFLGIWLAHTTTGSFFIVWLYLLPAGGDHRISPSGWCLTPDDIHAISPAPLGAGHRILRHLPVPVGLERSTSGSRLFRDEKRGHSRNIQACGFGRRTRGSVACAHGRRIYHDARPSDRFLCVTAILCERADSWIG